MTRDFRIERESALKLSDASLAWAVIEPLWNAIDFSGDWPVVSAILAQATVGQCELFALDWCQKEIRNGGLDQFFHNSTGMLAPEALAGFRRVGAHAYVEILAQALSLFQAADYPRATTQRRRFVAAIPDRRRLFGKLEEKFFLLLREDDLEAYRGAYVRRHPEEFLTSAGQNRA